MRPSRLEAMVALSTLVRMSSGRYVMVSRYIMRSTASSRAGHERRSVRTVGGSVAPRTNRLGSSVCDARVM